MFSWGGNSFWWHEIQPDSIYQSKWRGDVTPRSQVLLGKENLVLPLDGAADEGNAELQEENRKVEYIKVRIIIMNCCFVFLHFICYFVLCLRLSPSISTAGNLHLLRLDE